MLSKILFILSCLPITVGIAMVMALAGKPIKPIEQLRGIARALVVLGSIFGPVMVMLGWEIPWPVAALTLGISILICIHARENHLLARAKELLDDVGQKSGAPNA